VIHLGLLRIDMLNHPVLFELLGSQWNRPAGQAVQQGLDRTQIAAQVLQLVLDATAQLLAAGMALLDHDQIRLARLLPIGLGFAG
jgi:hypothetical protein